jgi:hypothetical protein
VPVNPRRNRRIKARIFTAHHDDKTLRCERACLDSATPAG